MRVHLSQDQLHHLPKLGVDRQVMSLRGTVVLFLKLQPWKDPLGMEMGFLIVGKSARAT
jgi:hypothetical protein